MRICLVGGAGFIGRHVIDALARAKLAADCVVYDSFEEVVHGAELHEHPPASVTGFETVQQVPVACTTPANLDKGLAFWRGGNLLNPTRLQAEVNDADVIVHLAAAVSVSSSFDQPARFVQENALGTACLWGCIHERPKPQKPLHVVNFSSMSVYGHGQQYIAVMESRPTAPLNVYALSKLQAEQMCLLGAELYGVRVTNFRLWNCYGPGQSLHNAETGVVAIWLSALLQGQPITVYEDGHQLRDFVYVTDVANAVVLAVTKPVKRNGAEPHVTVNIGTGESYAMGRVADAVCDAVKVNRVEPCQQRRVGDSRHCWPDISRAKRLLGYHPSVTLQQGLEKTVAWAKRELVTS